jgi:hypothetical protein
MLLSDIDSWNVGALRPTSMPQAERLRTDLTELGNKLRAAADVYDQQDHEAGGALESSVRYD